MKLILLISMLALQSNAQQDHKPSKPFNIDGPIKVYYVYPVGKTIDRRAVFDLSPTGVLMNCYMEPPDNSAKLSDCRPVMRKEDGVESSIRTGPLTGVIEQCNTAYVGRFPYTICAPMASGGSDLSGQGETNRLLTRMVQLLEDQGSLIRKQLGETRIINEQTAREKRVEEWREHGGSIEDSKYPDHLPWKFCRVAPHEFDNGLSTLVQCQVLDSKQDALQTMRLNSNRTIVSWIAPGRFSSDVWITLPKGYTVISK